VLLPADIEPRSFLGADSVSYSELSSLASCERKWQLQYTGDREKSAPSAAMVRGTELHRLWGLWWSGGNWEQTEDETALWVMQRFAEHYVPTSLHLTMKAIEPPLCASLPDGTTFFGWSDGLLVDDNTGEYWNAECKSAGQLSARVYLEEQIQQKLYVWAWRQMGVNVVGSMLDVLCTTGADKVETKADAYKRHRAAGHSVAVAKELQETDRLKVKTPLAESFYRSWLRYSDEQIQDAVYEAMSATKVRRELLAGRRAMRDVGFGCNRCFVQAPCFGLDVTVEDDDAEQPF
jgi:hypothetical protein